MIRLRRAKERDHVRRRKQEVWRTFYAPDHRKDPSADSFGVLELLNEIRLPPGVGVAPHARQDTEVVTYVLKGELAQEDSTGHSGVIRAGEFQRMTTGCSVSHSERNASQADLAHVFRMYLHPSESELDCTREQKLFSVAERRGVLRIVVSPDGRKGSLCVHQDAQIYSAMLDPGQHLVHELPLGRIAWLHVVSGEATIGDLVLTTGDGVGVTDEPAVSLTAQEETEILLIDLNHQTTLPKN